MSTGKQISTASLKNCTDVSAPSVRFCNFAKHSFLSSQLSKAKSLNVPPTKKEKKPCIHDTLWANISTAMRRHNEHKTERPERQRSSNRDEICGEHRDRRSNKNFASCLIFFTLKPSVLNTLCEFFKTGTQNADNDASTLFYGELR